MVIGSSGFVGEATVAALAGHGHEVVRVRAPRLPPLDAKDVAANRHKLDVHRLVGEFVGVDAVINAAGVPNASGSREGALNAANAAMPLLCLAAVEEAGVARFIQVSSAAVQGDRAVLDESPETHPFSAYSRSKALGERVLLALDSPTLTIYRPPGVHASGRRVTEKAAALARSPLASVAGKRDRPTPQALLGNVADALSFLATTGLQPPSIVIHPWEGLTTAQLLTCLGGRPPLHVPEWLARKVLALARLLSGGSSAVAANTRRVELMWLGQGQAESWLTQVGWQPPEPLSAWRELARRP